MTWTWNSRYNCGEVTRENFFTGMDDIQKELQQVHKKLEDIEKKQQMLKRIQDLDRLREEKQAKRPTGHSTNI